MFSRWKFFVGESQDFDVSRAALKPGLDQVQTTPLTDTEQRGILPTPVLWSEHQTLSSLRTVTSLQSWCRTSTSHREPKFWSRSPWSFYNNSSRSRWSIVTGVRLSPVFALLAQVSVSKTNSFTLKEAEKCLKSSYSFTKTSYTWHTTLVTLYLLKVSLAVDTSEILV